MAARIGLALLLLLALGSNVWLFTSSQEQPSPPMLQQQD